jgi:hypothetical protein
LRTSHLLDPVNSGVDTSEYRHAGMPGDPHVELVDSDPGSPLCDTHSLGMEHAPLLASVKPTPERGKKARRYALSIGTDSDRREVRRPLRRSASIPRQATHIAEPMNVTTTSSNGDGPTANAVVRPLGSAPLTDHERRSLAALVLVLGESANVDPVVRTVLWGAVEALTRGCDDRIGVCAASPGDR